MRADNFKIQRSISQSAEFEIEIAVDRAAIYYMREILIDVLETHVQPHFKIGNGWRRVAG